MGGRFSLASRYITFTILSIVFIIQETSKHSSFDDDGSDEEDNTDRELKDKVKTLEHKVQILTQENCMLREQITNSQGK